MGGGGGVPERAARAQPFSVSIFSWTDTLVIPVERLFIFVYFLFFSLNLLDRHTGDTFLAVRVWVQLGFSVMQVFSDLGLVSLLSPMHLLTRFSLIKQFG